MRTRVATVIMAAALFAVQLPVQGADPRLNRMIELWEQGKPAFGAFARFRDMDGALYYGASDLDFVIFDMEHGPADFTQFKIFLQFMLDKSRLLKKGNPQAEVVPLARIPSNGGEQNQWLIKQVLDAGAYGLMAPHIASIDDARALVANSRYPQRLGAPDSDPPGKRGVAPSNAARYWGTTVPEYLDKADAWPLDPRGEIAVIAMFESADAVRDAGAILSQVKGISAVFIGPFDLSTSLGYPGQPDHPETERAIQSILAATRNSGVPCGVLVTKSNIEKRVREGFKFLVIAGSPADTEEALRIGRRAVR